MKALAIAAAMSLVVLPPVAAEAMHNRIECNPNGFFMQPDTRYRARENIYLGRSCDAFNDAWNAGGRWCWSESAIEVRLENGQIDRYGFELPSCAPIASDIRACECVGG